MNNNTTSNIKLFIGEHGTGKTKNLILNYLDIIDTRDSENIAVFVRNKTHEVIFRDCILNNIQKPIGNIKVFRFRAFVNQVLNTYWFKLFDKEPNFIGFSESIFLLKEFIKNYRFKDSENILNINSLKSGKYNKSIILGIFERQQRRAENGISFKDLDYISNNGENNTLSFQINQLLEDYSNWLISHKKPYLDYALQLDYFSKLIMHEDVINNISKEFKHTLLIDDIDDSFYIEHQFYERLWGRVKNITYTGNKYGSFRQFNGSDIYYIKKLESKVKEIGTVVNLNDNNSVFSKIGKSLYESLTDNSHFFSYDSLDKYNNIEFSQNYNYGEMIEEINKLPAKLKDQGFKADDIIIITQTLDEQIQLEIQRSLKEIDWESEIIKGSEELIKKPIINTVITLLRIVYYKEIKDFENFPQLTAFDFSQLIHLVGTTDHYFLAKLRKNLKNNPENWIKFFEDFSKKESFITVKNIYEIIEHCNILKNKPDSKEKYLEMVIYIWQSLIRKNSNLSKYNLKDDFKIFIEMISKHLELSYEHNIDKPFLTFILSLINGEISDNPDKDIIFNNNVVKIMTIQKISELKQESKIQIWLDVTNSSWFPSVGIYVNPYVLLPDRKKTKWSSYEEMKTMEKKLASTLRHVVSLAKDKIYMYSADYNAMGESNNHDLIKNIVQLLSKGI